MTKPSDIISKKNAESKDVDRMLRIYQKIASLQRIRKPGPHGISVKNASKIPRRGVGLTSGPEAVDSAKDKSFGVRFPLTREVVISKHSTIHEPGIFFQPERERGFEMVYNYPKTPLLRTDGERGFCI